MGETITLYMPWKGDSAHDETNESESREESVWVSHLERRRGSPNRLASSGWSTIMRLFEPAVSLRVELSLVPILVLSAATGISNAKYGC